MMSETEMPRAVINRQILQDTSDFETHLKNAKACNQNVRALRDVLWGVIGDCSPGLEVSASLSKQLTEALIANQETVRGGLLSADLLLSIASGAISRLSQRDTRVEELKSNFEREQKRLTDISDARFERAGNAIALAEQRSLEATTLRVDLISANKDIAKLTAKVRKLQSENRKLKKQATTVVVQPPSRTATHREVDEILL